MYSVEIENNGTSLMKARSEGYEFNIDNNGSGITPPATLLASLGSCIGVYIRKYAEGVKLKINGFKVSVTAEFAKERPISFKNINVSIDLTNAKIDDKKKESLLRFIKNCPIHNTLKDSPNIEVTLS